MKKESFFIIILLLILGCNSIKVIDEKNFDIYNRHTKSQFSNEAEQCAVDAVLELIQELDGKERGNDSRIISDVLFSETLSDPTEGEVLSSPVYIVNFKNNAGFAIASADYRLPPVLCVVDSGHFYVGDELPLGAIAMLSNIEFESDFDTKRGSVYPWNSYPPDSVFVIWSTVSIGNIHGTRVTCNWDQEPRFNNQCPIIDGKRAPTGCVPVAVGQIMYYYGQNSSYNGSTYDWSILHNVVDSTSCPMYAGAWSGVSGLLRNLGNSDNLNATYRANSTSAYSSLAPRTFENFGYQSGGTYTDYNYWMLSYEIVHNHPVLLSAKRSMAITTYPSGQVDTSYYHGHSWVADQFLSAVRRVTVYDRTTYDILYTGEFSQHYVHCNWGWSGLYNGFFLSGQFNYKDSLSVSTKSQVDSINGYEYKYLLKQVTGIRP